VLVVDSVFAMRPEYDDLWDCRVWLDVSPATSLRRGIARDTHREGGVEAATRLRRDRYHAAELIYLAEADPLSRADLVIDNEDVAAPRVR
jgi:uridine kinase